MPSYEFKCQKCGKKATIVLPISDYEKKNYKCPKCGSKRLERLISTFQAKTSRKS
jgi:putative FmdB family regulatory protein